MTNRETIEPVRFQNLPELLMAGKSSRYSEAEGDSIPEQWQDFQQYLGDIQGQSEPVAYGVCSNFDDRGNYDYMCCVAVKAGSPLPHGFTTLKISPQRYAVFSHAGHVSQIKETWDRVWKNWLPKANQELANSPFFESYDENFDSETGMGGIELWLPVK